MHLKQLAELGKPRFTNSVCRLFTKNKVQIKKLKETGDSKYIYKNDLNKTYFQHEIDLDCKKLPKRSVANKMLRDEVSNITKSPKYQQKYIIQNLDVDFIVNMHGFFL